MTKIKLRVVLDTNVFLSGFIFGGNCDRILRMAMKYRFNLLISPSIILEIREKLETKFKADKERVETNLKAMFKVADLICPNESEKITSKLNDKDYEKILRATKTGKADFIVTGDKHLLVLKRFGQTKIVTPSQFLDLIYKKRKN
jgi:uncharacterized protein